MYIYIKHDINSLTVSKLQPSSVLLHITVIVFTSSQGPLTTAQVPTESRVQTQVTPDSPVTTQGPMDSHVTTPGPMDSPVTTQEPVDSPVTTPGTMDSPVTTQGPVDSPVTTPGPMDSPVTTQGPVDSPVTTPGTMGDLDGLEVTVYPSLLELKEGSIQTKALQCNYTYNETPIKVVSSINVKWYKRIKSINATVWEAENFPNLKNKAGNLAFYDIVTDFSASFVHFNHTHSLKLRKPKPGDEGKYFCRVTIRYTEGHSETADSNDADVDLESEYKAFVFNTVKFGCHSTKKQCRYMSKDCRNCT